MKLGEYFRDAIESADWKKVCKVFTQITGEDIEPPRAPILADLDMPEDDTAPLSPADMDMPEEDEEEEEEDESESTTPAEQVVEDDQQATPADNPTRQPTIDDFRVERQPVESDDIKDRLARKLPMNIPRKRQNKFGDNQTIAMKDSVKKNPKLGVQKPTPRGQRGKGDLSDAKDTSVRVKVVCSLCGKEETVSEQLAVGWYQDKPGTRDEDKKNTYKCNECQTPAGRARLARKRRDF